MTKKRYIFIAVILVLIQIIINVSFSVSTMFFLAPVCFLLLGMERGLTSVKCMILAFLIGLVVDLMSAGIPGLWSASLTAAAVPRLAFIRRRAWEDESGLYDMPSPAEIGAGVYFFYALSVNVVFYVVYVMVERMSPFLTLAEGAEILLSVVANTVLLLVIALFVQDKRRY